MKVVESHHQVLSVWAEYRRQKERAPYLITLDHHTDTSFPFRKYLAKKFPNNKSLQEEERQNLLKEISYLNTDSVLRAQSLLSHDEHILTAIACDILAGVFVVAHNAMDTDLQVYREHKVCCYSVARGGRQASLKECDRVLESDFLNQALLHFRKICQEASEGDLLKQDYILDVDLDYFNTLQGTSPSDAQVYQSLFKNAGLVTVAMESDHVELCAREQGLNSSNLLQRLKQLHASAH